MGKYLDKLAVACEGVEAALGRIENVQWGCYVQLQSHLHDSREEEDELGQKGWENYFNHSWTPSGSRPGWFWIPKGRLMMDICYPGRLADIRRFGHTAKKIRATPSSPPLTTSFSRMVKGVPMANQDQQRKAGKRRTEDWMEEDDPLGGELRQEQELIL